MKITITMQAVFCVHYWLMSVRCVDKRTFALSIRDFNETSNDVTIKHYRIRTMDKGGVYISPRKVFADILQLVEHYQSLSGF